MRIRVVASYAGKGVSRESLAAQDVDLAPGAAHTLAWNIQAPEANLLDGPSELEWRIEASDMSQTSRANTDGKASDRRAGDTLVFRQALLPAVPIKTRQASLFSLDPQAAPLRLPVSAPQGALVDANGIPRGGLQVHMQSSLAGGLPGVHEWFAAYPYTCLEQLASKAIGLRSAAQWQELMQRLSTYLDEDGLAAYFAGAVQGNEVLTAYLLAASHEAQALGLPFPIPAGPRASMTHGLLALVQGKNGRASRRAPVGQDVYDSVAADTS